MRVKVTGKNRTFVLEGVAKKYIVITIYEKKGFFQRKVHSQTYLREYFTADSLTKFIEKWA